MSSVQDVFDRYGVDYRASGHHHCRPGWVQLDCPECSPGWRSYRLGFSLSRGSFHCWACGSLPRDRTLAAVCGVTPREARAIAARLPSHRVEEETPRGKLVLPPDLGPLAGVHKKYLRERGLDPDQLTARYGLKGIGPGGGRYAWRIFIPIVYRGEVVSWTTRGIAPHQPRYLSAAADQEKMNHKHLLFGADLCGGVCVVTEGPFDAMRFGPGAVCTFGTSVSQEQLLRVSHFARRVVWFDGDAAGRGAAARLAAALAPLAGETFVISSAGKDVGSASARDIDTVRTRFFGPSRPVAGRSAAGSGRALPAAQTGVRRDVKRARKGQTVTHWVRPKCDPVIPGHTAGRQAKGGNA